MRVVIKAHDHRAVTRQQQLKERIRRFLDVVQNRPCALARIYEKSDRECLFGGAEKFDILLHAVLKDRKVSRFQIRNIAAVAVADDDRHADKPRVDLIDLGGIFVLPKRADGEPGQEKAKKNWYLSTHTIGAL